MRPVRFIMSDRKSPKLAWSWQTEDERAALLKDLNHLFGVEQGEKILTGEERLIPSAMFLPELLGLSGPTSGDATEGKEQLELLLQEEVANARFREGVSWEILAGTRPLILFGAGNLGRS